MPGFSVNGRDPMAAGTFSVGHKNSLMGSVRFKYGDAAYSETELFAKVLWQIEDARLFFACATAAFSFAVPK
jgi:hypothetical protein